jgi:transcriptional regulator with XRE-family HTH domain
MHTVCPEQIRAARSYLGWTQKQLEEVSGVCLTAIRDFEDGSSPRRDTIAKLCSTFEKHGVLLTADGGLKPRRSNFDIFDGTDSCEKLFNDILQTIKVQGGEVLAFLESQKTLTRPYGSTQHSLLERLSLVHQITPVRCIVTEPLKLPAPLPLFKLRTAPRRRGPALSTFSSMATGTP